MKGITMELKTCEECGRTFAAENGRTLCKRCFDKKIDNDFKLVRDYLYDHPGADIKEVADETGVDEAVILKLLKQDRIEVVEEANTLLRCEKCGKSIKSGRLCDDCKKMDTMKQMRDVRDQMKENLDKSQEANKNSVSYHSR